MKSARHAIIPLIFILLGFLIYSNVLHGPFIFDDEWYIATDYKIRNISNFLNDFSGTRYVVFLSFAINYYISGLNTFGYHLVNIIIHIANTILVYFLIQLTIGRLKITDSRLKAAEYLGYLPFIASLIFLVHPVQTQAVSYITQRFVSLATLFYLLAVVLYIKARIVNMQKKRGWRVSFLLFYFFAILSTVLAMKTKEISFTLPFVILLYEFTFLNENNKQHVDCRSRIFYLIPFLAALLIIPITLFLPATNTDFDEIQRQLKIKELSTLSKYEYFLTQFNVIVTYIRLLLFPVTQHFVYDYPISKSLFEIKTFSSLVILLLIFGFGIYMYLKSRRKLQSAGGAYGILIALGIFWFFIALSVESSVIPIYNVIFEHRIYLPSVGFIISIITAVLYGFSLLEKKTGRPLHNYLFFAVFIMTAIFSFSTYERNILWSDEYKMWLDNVNKAPNRIDARNNLGNVYAKQGRFDAAIKEYLFALTLDPNIADTHYNLGNVYFNLGYLDGAVAEYIAALRLKPDDAVVHGNLGVAYHNQGRLNDAITEYIISLKLNPNDALTHNNLGFVYYTQDRLDDAVAEYKIALRLDPNNVLAHNNMGNVYMRKGLKDGARKEFEMVLKLNPADTNARQAIESLEK